MNAVPPDRYAIFLDIDGTYAHRSVVPPEHVAAVQAVRTAGHAVFLCTGRPRCMVGDHLLTAGFDGFVGGAGAYVEVGGTVVIDTRFPPGLARRAVDVLVRHDAAFLLEAPESVYGPRGIRERLGRHFAAVFPDGGAMRQMERDIISPLIASEDPATMPFGKITIFDSPTPVATLAAEIGPEVGALPSSVPGMGESAGEIYQLGVNKAVGMRRVSMHVGIPVERLVAVGDGANDIEMISEAGIGVAIEGAAPEVLAVADRTARGPEKAGLADLFQDLALLQPR